MTPSERAERAIALLDEPVFKAAMTDIREQIIRQLESTPFGDVDTHHHSTLMLQALKQIQTQLKRYADEIAIDKHKQRNSQFIEKMKQSINLP